MNLKGGDAVMRVHSRNVRAHRRCAPKHEGPSLVTWTAASAGRGKQSSQLNLNIKRQGELP